MANSRGAEQGGRTFRFSIAFVLAATAMVGTTFALLRHFDPYLLLPALAIPLSVAFEALTTGFGALERISCRSQLGRLSIVVVLSAVLAALSFWSLSAGYPTVATPLPFLSLIPAMNDLPLTLILGIPAIAFIATVVPNVWLQRDGLPVRFHFLLFAGTLASVHWLITGWPYAIQYQSRGYALGVAAVNLVSLCFLWAAAWILKAAARLAKYKRDPEKYAMTMTEE